MKSWMTKTKIKLTLRFVDRVRYKHKNKRNKIKRRKKISWREESTRVNRGSTMKTRPEIRKMGCTAFKVILLVLFWVPRECRATIRRRDKENHRHSNGIYIYICQLSRNTTLNTIECALDYHHSWDFQRAGIPKIFSI